MNPKGLLIASHCFDDIVRDLALQLKRQRPNLVCLVTLYALSPGDCTPGPPDAPVPDRGTAGWRVAVALLAALATPRLSEAPETHSLERWVRPVVRLIRAPRDPRTVSEWGRNIGVSA